MIRMNPIDIIMLQDEQLGSLMESVEQEIEDELKHMDDDTFITVSDEYEDIDYEELSALSIEDQLGDLVDDTINDYIDANDAEEDSDGELIDIIGGL